MTDAITIDPVAVLCTADHLPVKIVRPLYENQLDFNYLEERYLHCGMINREKRHLQVGPYTYGKILVEDPSIFSCETHRLLTACQQAGIDIVCPFPEGNQAADRLPEADGWMARLTSNKSDLSRDSWINDLQSGAWIDCRSLDPSGRCDQLRLTCQKREADSLILLVDRKSVV